MQRQGTRSVARTAISDPALLALIALGWLLLLTLISALTSGQYGFHRDELNFIENARHLDWGYVEYPPLTPFLGRIVLDLFGLSIVALHFLATLAVCVALWLTGMMTRALGGSRAAQVVAALAASTAPIVLFNTRFFSYQTFDYLWWVLTAYFIIRRLKSGDPRWWLAIGAALGLGMMTKYSIPFLVAGIAVGILLTPARRDLKSPWLWAGVGLALLIFLPNLIWQIQHHWISLEFQSVTRERNVIVGRTEWIPFLLQQFYVCTNGAALFLWTWGLYFCLFKPEGKQFRPLGWLYVVPFILFMAAQGRFYYMAGTYPMLLAVGASQQIREPVSLNLPSILRRFGVLIVVGLAMMAIMLPVTPVNSAWWRLDSQINPEIREEIGWPELVAEVARIYNGLPPAERSQTAVLTANYGEASAVNLYGPEYGLPGVISPINTFWLRGYGSPPPQKVIVLGVNRSDLETLFTGCQVAGHTPNPYQIENEETRDHPDIFLCGSPRIAWPELWKIARGFG